MRRDSSPHHPPPNGVTTIDDVLAEAGVARVSSLEGPGRFRYLRLREPPYDERALTEWAQRLAPVADEGIDVYCYFKHEDEPTGPLYAEHLLELLGTQGRFSGAEMRNSSSRPRSAEQPRA